MVFRCTIIALLAVAAAAVPMGCNSGCNNVVSSGCGGIVGGSSSSSSVGGAITRNIVAKGKYPVALANCGPTPDRQIPVTTSHVRAPVQEKPTVRLPCNIPAPRTVSHTCTCYKTIVRPRVHQQIVSVPSVQRYIETTHRPVVENIHYEACPVNCNDESNLGYQAVEVPAQGGVQQVQSCGQQTIEIPQVQSCGQQTIQLPQVQSCGQQQVQTIQLPQVQSCGQQTIQLPQVQTVQIPQVQSCGQQTIQLPQVQSCGQQQVQTIQIPQVQTVQIPQVQTVQIPQVQTCGQQAIEIPSSQGSCLPAQQTFSFGPSCPRY